MNGPESRNESLPTVGDWQREQILGSGGFGIVSVWKHLETGERIALKQCKWGSEKALSAKYKERWKQEVDIMHRLQHENVIRAIQVRLQLQ